MNKYRTVVILAGVFALSAALISPAAFADKHKGLANLRGAPLAGLVVKSLAGNSHHKQRGALLSSPSIRGSAGSLLNQGSHRQNRNAMSNLGSLLNQMPRMQDRISNGGQFGQFGGRGISPETLRNVGSWLNDSGVLNQVAGSGYGGYGDGFRDYRHHSGMDSAARAYRDVGMANAIVNLVGIVATTAAQTSNVRPAGYYAREKVIVQPSHYESVRVWIPEIYDPRTGQKTGGGYYETQTQLVPEVVEYRDVWTPAAP